MGFFVFWKWHPRTRSIFTRWGFFLIQTTSFSNKVGLLPCSSWLKSIETSTLWKKVNKSFQVSEFTTFIVLLDELDGSKTRKSRRIEFILSRGRIQMTGSTVNIVFWSEQKEISELKWIFCEALDNKFSAIRRKATMFRDHCT